MLSYVDYVFIYLFTCLFIYLFIYTTFYFAEEIPLAFIMSKHKNIRINIKNPAF